MNEDSLYYQTHFAKKTVKKRRFLNCQFTYDFLLATTP